MTDTNDKDRKPDGNRPGGGTLTLKRPSIEQSKVKQSFGAGRSKTVVVETKRKRFGDDKPAAAEAKPAFQAAAARDAGAAVEHPDPAAAQAADHASARAWCCAR